MTHPARNHAGPHRDGPAEPIEPGQLWPLSLLHTRLAWGARSIAAAQREGLVVHRWGKRAYVATDDLIEFLTRSKAGEKPVAPAKNGGGGEEGVN